MPMMTPPTMLRKTVASGAKPSVVKASMSRSFSTMDLEQLLRRLVAREAGFEGAVRGECRWQWSPGMGPVVEVMVEQVTEPAGAETFESKPSPVVR